MNNNLLRKLNIAEYYLKEVYSRGGKYKKGHPIQDRLVLCPLHDDKNPSMGFIQGKDGIMKFHCFGCGRAGNVIDLHQGIHPNLSEEDALKEICKILDVEYIEDTVESQMEMGVFENRLASIKTFNSSLTQAGFSSNIKNVYKNGGKEELNRLLLNTLWLLNEG